MEQRMSAFERYEHGLVLKQIRLFDSALEDFRHAARDPQYAGKAHAQLALCFRGMGRHEEAAAAFRQALSAPTLSSEETVHILYLLGQTLESLGRYAEALEAYGWVRQEDAGFRDVASRIKHLSSGRRGPVPQQQRGFQSWVEEMLRLERQLRPQIVSLLGQMWEWLGQYAKTLETSRWVKRTRSSFRDIGHQSGHRELTLTRGSLPASRDRRMDKRQHVRVAVRCRSQFSSKGRGWPVRECCETSRPGGCRVTSSIVVPVGAELECWIFPQNEVHPFTIEGATVRWRHAQEFGLAFTNVRPGVQRQIAQLCAHSI